ncbi:conserved Plasmodium membrane protein, unknown function [Plasmodium sp. gorilla clade G2]|uniref:conserved Plasmodium membrane protein, unknown function n=1 Tax=Plasmodium sp. gorilla clade G2 TaxID=880535 RepID=UPI000D215446|nr:conserved Plasmodium membrane protein, unknown function [Plasmodium sp. gorilla clade G2]SOV14031.1 conserved Plasmodium membrane protein, unknown function [Plasmodium sp. gorilla clade G2]
MNTYFFLLFLITFFYYKNVECVRKKELHEKYKTLSFINSYNNNEIYNGLSRKAQKKIIGSNNFKVHLYNKQNILYEIKKKIISFEYEQLKIALKGIIGLFNIFGFMLLLNHYNFINETHAKSLIEITDKINSKIFLFNTINDVIRKIPEELHTFLKVSLFALAHFSFQLIISNISSYAFSLFRSQDINNDYSQYKLKNINEDYKEELKKEEKPNLHSNYNLKDILKRKMLKSMCILNHTGFIPMYMFNYILKKFNLIDNNITIFINLYHLLYSMMSKIYIHFFINNKENIILSFNKIKYIDLIKNVFFNTYSFFIYISLFLKYFKNVYTIYEAYYKPILTTFHSILIPSILIILSNILYQTYKVNTHFSFKDLFYVLKNKYFIYPSAMYAFLCLNKRYNVVKINKGLQLFFLIQSLTPPNYNIHFLNVRKKKKKKKKKK